MNRFIRELIQSVLLAGLVFFGLSCSLENFRVEGSSMQPTLEAGEYVLVNKLVYSSINLNNVTKFIPFVDIEKDGIVYPFHPPRWGEVIVFQFPIDHKRDFVKRVVGVPGDTVEIKGGLVYINDTLIPCICPEEPYTDRLDRRSLARMKVPKDSYFVLGDNRSASNDSRDWGTVSLDEIKGQAWFTYWPVGRWHMLGAFSRVFQ